MAAGDFLMVGMSFMITDQSWLAIGLILVAEMIDRAEFYREMEIPTPSSLLQDELEARLEG